MGLEEFDGGGGGGGGHESISSVDIRNAVIAVRFYQLELIKRKKRAGIMGFFSALLPSDHKTAWHEFSIGILTASHFSHDLIKAIVGGAILGIRQYGERKEWPYFSEGDGTLEQQVYAVIQTIFLYQVNAFSRILPLERKSYTENWIIYECLAPTFTVEKGVDLGIKHTYLCTMEALLVSLAAVLPAEHPVARGVKRCFVDGDLLKAPLQSPPAAPAPSP